MKAENIESGNDITILQSVFSYDYILENTFISI